MSYDVTQYFSVGVEMDFAPATKEPSWRACLNHRSCEWNRAPDVSSTGRKRFVQYKLKLVALFSLLFTVDRLLPASLRL